MTPSRNGAWTKAKSQETIEALRNSYPRYTDNELYAIWCREHGLIPLDSNQKVDLDTWRIHASQDGQHLRDGGFQVSRAIYGRALKAQEGMPKPRQNRRKRGEIESAHTELESGNLSERALQLAKSYDRAAALVRQALAKRKEALEFAAQLRGLDPCIAIDLVTRYPEARGLMKETGVLPELEGATRGEDA